jgi:hypothetical protein
MALCRFGNDSDLYVYYSIYGGIICCRCSLIPVRWISGPNMSQE